MVILKLCLLNKIVVLDEVLNYLRVTTSSEFDIVASTPVAKFMFVISYINA